MPTDWSTMTLAEGSQVATEWEDAVGTGSTILDGASPRTLVASDYSANWFRTAGARAMFPKPTQVGRWKECRCPCATNPCGGPVFIDYGASSGSINFSMTETYYVWDGVAWVVDSTVNTTDNQSLAGTASTADRYPHDDPGKCWASIQWTTGSLTFTLTGDTAELSDGNGSLVTATGDFALVAADAYVVSGSDSGGDDYWEYTDGLTWFPAAGLPAGYDPAVFYRNTVTTWSGSFSVRYAAKSGLL